MSLVGKTLAFLIGTLVLYTVVNLWIVGMEFKFIPIQTPFSIPYKNCTTTSTYFAPNGSHLNNPTEDIYMWNGQVYVAYVCVGDAIVMLHYNETTPNFSHHPPDYIEELYAKPCRPSWRDENHKPCVLHPGQTIIVLEEKQFIMGNELSALTKETLFRIAFIFASGFLFFLMLYC